ncbi:MAG: AAA family ATPase [Elusimicrobiota bacterium]|jgi:DNA repair exonuclease SbcCD ATPase subunit|nr:AAA family ATPase [Elusimicrobiota bacterium]
MKLLNLTLKNFRSFGPEIKFNLEEYNGLNLIVGPNGIGKTTTFDSIIYTLYGKVRDESIDDVVNRIIGENCKTSVEFEINEDKYKIVRYRKHTTHKNNIYIFKNNKDISLKNASDTQQIINDIIRIPYNGFINSTFFSSETYKPFLKARNSERLSIFENLLSLHEVNSVYDASRKHYMQLNDEINEVSNIRNVVKNEISAFENSIVEYKQNVKNKLLTLKAEKEKLEKGILNYKEKLEEWSNIDIENERDKYKKFSEKDVLKNKINNLHKEIKTLEEPSKQLRKSASLFLEIDWASELEKDEKKKDLEYKISQNIIKSRELKNKIDNLYNDKYRSEQTEEAILSQLNVLKNELDDIEKEICPRCHQHIDNSKDEKNEVMKKIFNYEYDLNEQIKISLNCGKEIGEKNEELLKLDEESSLYQREVLKLNILFDNAEKQKNEVENAYNKINAFNSEKKLIDEYNEVIIKQIGELQSKIDNIEDCDYTEEQLNNIDGEIKNFSSLINSSQDRLKEINGSVNSIYDKSYIVSIENKINEKNNALSEIEEKFEKLKDDNKYYSFICDCFSNKANSFKKYYIGEMIDLFNNKINQFLPFFFNENISIVFNKELNETILNGKDEITFASLSTGQKQRCELAISFALFNTARVFFANDSNILILDEVLDQGLDFDGIRSAITILEGLEKDNKIFIVSHNPNIQDLVENVIKIKRVEGFSVIS